MQAATGQSIAQVSGITPWPRKVYRNPDKFWEHAESLHYAYIVYRTLRGDYAHVFQPDAVFYVGRSPGAYLKTVRTDKISERDVRAWQRFLWNQSVVPLLIIKSRKQIRVYTAYTEPHEGQSTELIQPVLEAVADALELDQLYTMIEVGSIHELNPEAFNRSRAIDHYLVENLNAAAYQLAGTQEEGDKSENLEFAHQFLTRFLFVCYLVERGMVKGKHFSDPRLKRLRPASQDDEGYHVRHLFDDLATSAQRREALYLIFSYVRRRFNGSLFTESLGSEKARITDAFIGVLDRFLRGQDLGTGQMTLGFWAYDFSVIPIETISAVYQRFLGAQGQVEELAMGIDSRRSAGAYYTPPHLADLTVDMALEGIEKPIHKLKVLDSACGSGVFLVILFARMAKSLRRECNHLCDRPSIAWARKLLQLLHQLYGLDVNATACHITCFSLYLALLEELSPMDVEYLHRFNEKLPPLRADTTANSWKTIHRGNLFDPKLSLDVRDFDLAIGNPPWVSRTNQRDEHFLKWRAESPKVRGPDKQIAHGFMWKVTEYLSGSGMACLLLPASVLLNKHTNRFQADWFGSFTVDHIVNYSDLSFFLFESVDRPCVSIRFANAKAQSHLSVRYDCPKTDIRSQYGGRVYVREEDATSVRVKDILDAARDGETAVVWKSHFWGSWRDRRLLTRLDDLPRLIANVGTVRKPKRFWKGQGFQPFNPKPGSDVSKIRKKKEPEKPWWTPDTLFLDARAVHDLLVTAEDAEPVGDRFPLLLFPKGPRLFSGPKVLVSQGSRDMKVAFCDDYVIFQDSLQTITGREEDADLLRFLTAVIKSDVAQYYLFHTSANWGTERDKVHLHELLSLPFCLPEDAHDPIAAQKIVDKAAATIKKFERRLESGSWFGLDREAGRIRQEVLEPLVRDYYDVDEYEAMLIEDTLGLAKESSTPGPSTKNIPTLSRVKDKDCVTYGRTFCKMVNSFGKGSNFKVQAEILSGDPYSIVHVALAEKPRASIPIVRSSERLLQTLRRLGTLLEKQEGHFVFCRSLKVFDGDSLYIVKPMQMRFWSRTAALNDADEIAGAIVTSRGSP
jgi:Eco57I restriction-modification methylase